MTSLQNYSERAYIQGPVFGFNTKQNEYNLSLLKNAFKNLDLSDLKKKMTPN